MRVSHFLRSFCVVFASAVSALASAEEPVRNVNFSRDIRPILSDICFTCHGPDEQQRVNDLRLDKRDGVFSEREGRPVIVPGDISASLLHQRITSTDQDKRMPPKDSGRNLTEHQIRLLTDWISQGAAWSEHWAFIPPERHEPPVSQLRNWGRNPIDNFVLAQLEQEGLQPAEEANRNTLIRRVSLDLTGIPPTPDEVQAFLADSSPDAWETAVDRLLASPRYGEQMAVAWLDAARYADTSGYQNDGPRYMWRWRDWVIHAFNTNQRFDQFTIEQLAGDLLENPTLDQQIATGFNRNHRGNAEGGIIPEEYQVEYVADRVDTTFTVWLGLTIGCARCHDHKYDPIRQKDFYQVFAYFNNIPENGRAIKEGNSPPWIKAPLPEQQAHLARLDEQIDSAEVSVKNFRKELNETQAVWEAGFSANESLDLSVTEGLVSHLRFDGNLTDSARNVEAVFEDAADDSSRGATGPRVGADVDTVPKVAPATYAEGLLGQAARFDGRSLVKVGDTANFGYFDKFSIAAWVRATGENGTLVSRMTEVDQGAGYSVHLSEGRVQVNLINRWLDDAIRVESRDPFPLDEWHHVTVTYDGSRVAAGIKVFVDGSPVPMEVKLDRINQTFALPKEPVRIGGGQSHFAGVIDDVRIYGRDLSTAEVQLLAVPQTVSEILAMPARSRSEVQRLKLTEYYLQSHAPTTIREAHLRLAELRQQRRTLDESVPTVMVMQDMQPPRETHVLIRGQYDQPGERLQPGVPAVFPSLPVNAPNNRLGFAQWLVSPDHPLTARVAVNRFWQRYFGEGLVKTTEDFGAQGESPSHPELLDWLATEFVRSGWDVKALQKLIVSSSVYRQSSQVSPEMLLRDPDNRLLARGRRGRLPAETIRDQALFVSGLLNETMGGPSVKPYQPVGLWQEIATDIEYTQSHGADLYRRSLYTYWKRTVAPPTMLTLDATTREACTVQRTRTNTPLQALALMNDVTFVEAARVLAQRLMTDINGSTADRLVQAFAALTARQPKAAELEVLQRRFSRSLEEFRNDPSSAERFIHTGESEVDTKLDACELAAFTTVTSLILNLDEVVNQN